MVRELFGATPDAWQERALEAFPQQQRVAVKANKGPGKTALDAWLGWNFLLCYKNPKVAATSVSGDNLRDGLWAEMAKWQARAPFLKAAFTWSAERIWCNAYKETWWASARQWSKSADPAQQADTLAGLHADNILFILDEAGGIPDSVMAAAEAALATGKNTKLLITGNPTQTSGPLWRAFTRERHLWFLVEVTGDPDDPNRSPRVSKEWAREQIEKYGRDHPYVIVNVFGQFPPTQSNALLGIEDVSAAARRTVNEHFVTHEPRILGVDVARFGDDRTVIFPRQGQIAMQPQVLRNLDTMEVAGQVSLAATRWAPHAIFVDVTGIGAGVVDRLKQLGISAIGVEFGGKPSMAAPPMADKRMEMWHLMSEWLKAGGCIPDDPELISELSAPTYSFDANNRLRLEKKDDIKKRGLPSPDKADALALTFAFPVRPPAVMQYRAYSQNGAGLTSMLVGVGQENSNMTQHEYDPYAGGR